MKHHGQAQGELKDLASAKESIGKVPKGKCQIPKHPLTRWKLQKQMCSFKMKSHSKSFPAESGLNTKHALDMPSPLAGQTPWQF